MIHYFLEGELGYDYRDSWAKHAGHIEWMKWDSSNLPIEEYPIVKKYIDNKKWSVVSDFARRWAIFKYGGIYLDFDIELVKPIDSLLNKYSFVGIEGTPILANAAVTGGMPNNKHHNNMLNDYIDLLNNESGFINEVKCGPLLITEYVKYMKGGDLDNSDLYKVKVYEDFTTLPKEYFYPYNWNEEYRPSLLTQNTIGIHWWKHGWK